MGRKHITATAKFIMGLWNIGLFAYVWLAYYNAWTYDTHAEIGAAATIIAYIVIYSWLCNTYKAFKLASSSIAESIFNQVVSFGTADFILYLESCISAHGLVPIWRGVIIVLLQGLGSAIMVLLFKRYFMSHVPPVSTLLIYGKYISEEEASLFGKKLLKKYSHLFSIDGRMAEEEGIASLFQEIEKYKIVICYEITPELRDQVLKVCSEKHKQFYFTPSIGDLIAQGSEYKQLLDTPLMKYRYSYEKTREYGIKRVLDIILSFFFIILLSPTLLVTAIAIKIEDHGPVFYKQKRCTKNGEVFEMIKFRSMVVDAERDGVKPCVDNDPRITKVGKFIRAHRIDELPQLFNVLLGDMSFVGPRPERVEHVEQYSKELPEFRYRMRVKGGITGYAQIYGKYNTSAYDKLRLDLMYIENQSLVEDFKIVILTFRTLFQRESTEGFEQKKSQEMNQSIAK